jgi:hypothetical protein
VHSMDRDLLVDNAVSTVKTIKTFAVPVVHSRPSRRLRPGQPAPELADLLTTTNPRRTTRLPQLLGGHQFVQAVPRDQPPRSSSSAPVDRNLPHLCRARRAARGYEVTRRRSAAPRAHRPGLTA